MSNLPLNSLNIFSELWLMQTFSFYFQKAALSVEING